METILAFTSLVTLWLASFGVLAACQLSIATYRKKGLPDLSALWMLCAGVGALWLAQQQTDAPIFTGSLLFFAGFCGFNAGLFSATELKTAKHASVQESKA